MIIRSLILGTVIIIRGWGGMAFAAVGDQALTIDTNNIIKNAVSHFSTTGAVYLGESPAVTTAAVNRAAAIVLDQAATAALYAVVGTEFVETNHTGNTVITGDQTVSGTLTGDNVVAGGDVVVGDDVQLSTGGIVGLVGAKGGILFTDAAVDLLTFLYCDVLISGGDLQFEDGRNEYFGTGYDCKIYWDGTDMYISSANVTATDELYFEDFDNYLFDNNVGIGTSTPLYPLHVVGGITSTTDIAAGDDITAVDDITAGGNINATGTIASDTDIGAGGDLIAVDDVTVGDDVTLLTGGIVGMGAAKGNILFTDAATDLLTIQNADLLVNGAITSTADITSGDDVIVGDDVILGTGGLVGLGAGKGSFLFTDSGTDTIQLQDAIFYVGSISHHFAAQDDGFVTLVGNARASVDIKFQATRVVKGGVSDPANVILDGFAFVLAFDNNVDEEVFGSTEIPHNYCGGTDIKFHVHWAPSTAAAGSVTWGCEYEVHRGNNNSVIGAGEATVVIVDATQTLQDEVLSTDSVTINGVGILPEDTIIFRIFRDADASEGGAVDDYAADAYLIEADFEIMVDGFGEDEQW